ncbi:PREDICTED: uncharacterized protein LOC109588674 [Amphimedon queenslandica]|uniref:Death domain-containing protein n=1 Tax=Amphimedon queenslandica TaxID=400682 RepID=A0A1X7TCK9_AMPQE|nr:PREDICTED: uncharacterized protein LOC109588674 [Amphimedon queenslandica]|eukprot:XP_019860370.1 PREDICTED: uncharacterized protein LOC109588674 [Amphimedon queenslandica]
MAQHVHKERSFNAFLSSAPILSELLEHIDVGTKWYLLGTLLHVDDKRLNGIEQSQGHDDTSKALRMFQHWLTTTPTASRRQVLEALRKRVVNEHRVADKYEKYLKELLDTISTEAVSILQRNIQSLNKALVFPVQVSQMLYCKRCISEVTLDEMERMDQRRSLDDKKTTLLTAMKEIVSSDYRKLKDIAIVLSDFEELRDIANEMMTKYEEKIPQQDDSRVVRPHEVVGGNEGRASDILRNNYSALSQSITEPVCVARLLHEEVISDEALSCVMSIRGSYSDSRAVLLKAVRDAVHSNYKHLELFVTVLRKFSETAHIGDTILEEYKHYFKTDADDVEEIETYLTERGNSGLSQYVSSDSETEDLAIFGHKIPFPRNMGEEFKEMRIKFGSTFYNIRLLFSKKLAKSQKNISNVKALLTDIFPDHKSELSVAKTINDKKNNDSLAEQESTEASDTDTSIQEDEDVKWFQNGVRLFNPSLDSCKEVISKLEDKHEIMVLIASPSVIIQFLIPTILERKAIKQLTIYSSLTPEDILSFSSELSTNKSLTSLQIIHNSISDDGVFVLAEALQYNETLQYLYLNDNPDITSASAQSLAKLFMLSCLNLDNTNIDPNEVMDLMESLRTNNIQ